MNSTKGGAQEAAGPRVRAAAAPAVVDVRREGHKLRLVRAGNVFSFDGAEGARVRPPSRALPSSGQTPAARLDELVECAVCGERLQEPRMLPCQHTFCADCLVERLHSSRGRAYGVLRCATCGLELQLPLAAHDLATKAAAVLALPRNLHLESLLRLVDQQPPAPSGVPSSGASGSPSGGPNNAPAPGTPPDEQCARCQTVGAAVTRCQHCRQALCEVCWPAHLAELEQQLGALAAELEGAEERLQHRGRDYEERCEAAAARAAAAAEARREALRRDEERVAGEVAALRERASADAGALRAELQAARGAMRSDAAGCFDPLADKQHKVAEFLRAHATTAALLARVAHWGEARPSFDEEAFRVELLEAEAPPPYADVVAADVVAAATAPTANGVSVNAPRAPAVDVADAPDDDRAPPESADADEASLRYRVRAWAPRLTVRRSAMQRPAGAALAPWAAELFVAAADTHSVLVLDWAKGRLLRRLTAPDLLCPQGVAFSAAREEVYVADKFNHCVHVFSREGAWLRSLGRKGSQPGQLRAPEGLAAAPDADGHDLLYVCDAGNDRVQVLHAETGAAVQQIGVLPSQKRGGPLVTEFNQPTGVATCPALDLLAVSDCGHNRVKLYELSSGTKLRELGSRGGRRGQFRGPEAVALDAQGFLVVCDGGNARLQVFRVDDGRLVRVLGAGVLAWPAAVHVTPARDLVVVDSKTHTVYVL